MGQDQDSKINKAQKQANKKKTKKIKIGWANQKEKKKANAISTSIF